MPCFLKCRRIFALDIKTVANFIRACERLVWGGGGGEGSSSVTTPCLSMAVNFWRIQPEIYRIKYKNHYALGIMK